ncbi:DUF4238 domain-containing protein [Kitasatospora cineracea]
MQNETPPERRSPDAGEPAFHFDARAVAAEFLRRIDELKQNPVPPRPDQHLVARVLLKGWETEEAKGGRRSVQPFRIGEDGSIHQLNLYPASRAGFQTNWVLFGSGSLEQLWEKTEKKVPEIRGAIEAGTLFNRPDLVEGLKDLVALHHVRNNRQHGQFRVWLEENRSALDHAFTELGHIGDLPDDDQLFRVAAEQLFAFTRNWVKTGSVQILTPDLDDAEFVISDVPTLTVQQLNRTDTIDRFAVPLAEANCLFMPIGPRCVAAIGSETGYLKVPLRTVRGFNTQQTAHCYDLVFTRPGGPLQQFLSEHRQPPGPRRPTPSPTTAR